MPGGKAAATIGVTFAADEQGLHSDILAWAGIVGGKSEAMKMLARAGMGDKEAQAKIEALREAFETFRKLKGFTGAARLVAHELTPVVAAG